MSVKEYRRPWNAATWWLERPTWVLFMVRELTAVFVGGYALMLLIIVSKANNAEDFRACIESLKSPLWVVLHLVTLGMVVYHAVTWFQLTPQAMPVWRGEEKVSPALIVASNYVAWIVISFLVAWFALAG